jgi:hypothetical protein
MAIIQRGDYFPKHYFNITLTVIRFVKKLKMNNLCYAHVLLYDESFFKLVL